MTLDEATAQLTELYSAGRWNRFITRAHQTLDHVPHAPELAALTLRALLDLELGGPARELLQLRAELKPLADADADLAAALKQTPNGRVAWGKCAGIFRANSAALLRTRPELRDLVDSASRLTADVQLYRTRTGHSFVARRHPRRLREWLPGLNGDAEESQVRLPAANQLGAATIIGVRAGALLRQVYDNTSNLLLTYSHPLYIIEPDPVRFIGWLHCDNHEWLLADERVYFFVGEGATDRLAALLTEQPGLTLPQTFLNQSETLQGEQTSARANHAVTLVAQHHQTDLSRCDTELEDRHANRDAEYWTRRMATPGRVLGITSRYTTVLQHSMRDAMHALEAMGYETEILTEPTDHHQYSSLVACRKILDSDPTMVLLLDHMRYECPYLPKKLPLLAWIQDPMANLLCREAGESVGALDFVCGHHRDHCIKDCAYPEDAFVTANIPVSTRVFHDGDVPEADIAHYACDVCFVSNASEPIDRFYASQLKNYPPGYGPLLELVYDRAREYIRHPSTRVLGVIAQEMVKTAADEVGVILPPDHQKHVSSFFAYRLLDWGQRQQDLESVAAWARRTGRTLKIYGQGWEEHPSLAEFAAGCLEHGEPLRRAYRAAKLALQLIPAGFRHQRALEILACGTLPLTRYCAGDFAELPIEEYVAKREAGEFPDEPATIFPRLERVVFRTPEELDVLAERYLADEPERRTVLSDLRKVVLRDYTYDAVLKKVMKSFRERIERQAAPLTADCPA